MTKQLLTSGLKVAIARVIAEDRVLTYDMRGKDSTLDVAIAEYAS